MKRASLAAIAFLFIPLFWVLMNVVGARVGLIEMCSEWLDHWISGERWGHFDEDQ